MSLNEKAVEFLGRDFSECFEEKRRCEDRIWDIAKFTLAAYSAILGVSLGMSQFTSGGVVNLRIPSAALLGVAAFVGTLNLLLIIRTRVYFVLVARYINEQRKHFLDASPLGFQNQTGMYTNLKKPPFLSKTSSQTWAAVMVAVLNSALVEAASWVLGGPRWVFGIGFLMIQLGMGITYLKTREGKSADTAVFGRE